MKFVVDFPVHEISGRHKNDVLSKVTSGFTYGMSSSRNTSITGYHKGDTRRFFYLQKFNKKSSQIQKIVNGKNTTFTKVIRKPSWKAFYIDVPGDLIAEGKQDIRHFTLKLRNR